MYINIVVSFVGLDRTVVSILHCGCNDPGSIPGLVITFAYIHTYRTVLTRTHYHLHSVDCCVRSYLFCFTNDFTFFCLWCSCWLLLTEFVQI